MIVILGLVDVGLATVVIAVKAQWKKLLKNV